MRVLRPAPSKTGAPGGMTKEETKPADSAMIDMADANAIHEVDMAYENVKEVDGLDVSKEGAESWEAATKR